MQVKVLRNGDLELRDENGAVSRMGPHHPDYQAYFRSIRVTPRKGRLAGAACVLLGGGGFWINWHQIVTEKTFYPQMIFFAMLAVVFGLATLVKPEYAGPARDDADRRARMFVMMPLMLLAMAASGVLWYLLAD